MKSKLATVVTGAMLMLTTNTLPSLAQKTPKSSVTNNAQKLGIIIKRTEKTKKSGSLITETKQEIWQPLRVCKKQMVVYNQKPKKSFEVKICRPNSTGFYRINYNLKYRLKL